VSTSHTKDNVQNPPGPEPIEPAILPATVEPAVEHARTSSARVRAAWVVAVLVDAIQLGTSPAELAGPLAWFIETGADLITAAVMIWLLGFHWAFLPSFLTKMLPFIDLAPTWTAAVFFVTRARRKAAAPKDVH
jgi:hypothetical protein